MFTVSCLNRNNMKLHQGIILFIFLNSFYSAELHPSYKHEDSRNADTQKLVLFLMDGFRWDYLDYFHPNLTDLPGFAHLIQKGVKVDYLKPDFTSSSYPNYYTLMTGLHEENHGFVHNYMYDPVEDEEFLIGANEDQYNSHWWEDAEPFWITSVLTGKPIYMWYWCGCEVEIFGTRPTFCYSYQESGRPTLYDFNKAIDEGVEVLANGSAVVSAIYYEELDHLGHVYGPTAEAIGEHLINIDNSLVRMFEKLEEANLVDTTNIMMFADHGMTLSTVGQSVNLFDYITRQDYERQLGGSAVRQIWPYEGDELRVYNLLKNAHPRMQVYLKEDIPEQWHYKNHRRIPPILLVADLGWRIDLGLGFPGGLQWYDNVEPDMDGVFFAHGPLFKNGYEGPGLDSVELYQLMCHVIDLDPLPHNGTWDNVSDLLT